MRLHGCLPRAAFSLTELVVVMALLVVLTTMLIWGLTIRGDQAREKAGCALNLQKIHIALQIYATENSSKFPVNALARSSEEALDPLVPRYSVDTSLFICPGSKDPTPPPGESFRNRKISYAYYMGQHLTDEQMPLMSDAQVDTRPKRAGERAFSTTGDPPGNNHRKAGGNFLFCDGHVESTPATVPFSLWLTNGIVLLNPRR
jgi:prepilin-type processing-associated H-X9-DG protein